MKKKWKPSTEFYMVLPAVVILAIITLFPFFYTIWLSLMSYPMIQLSQVKFVGFANWARMFRDQNFWIYWWVTFKFAGSALAIEMLLGMIVALFISKIKIFEDLLTTIIIAPLFFAPVLVGLIGRFIYHDSYGIYTYFFHSLGLFKDKSLFGSRVTALPILIGLDVWEWTPLVILIFLAGIKSLPISPFEAASLDGANEWNKLWRLTIPMLKPVIFVALIIRTMDILRYFTVFLVTTRGGPADSTKIMSIAVYDKAFQAYRMGYASTMTLTMLFLTIVLGNIFVRFFLKKKEEA
ncbi:MAG: sugar ABC transporter permease [Spirochaetes bacterium]|nr:sugar ABC transporter permease [Spirochaetota bacterium]